jgi:hypothetical protein
MILKMRRLRRCMRLRCRRGGVECKILLLTWGRYDIMLAKGKLNLQGELIPIVVQTR